MIGVGFRAHNQPEKVAHGREITRRRWGPHMTNTDSTPFMDLAPAISLREAERGAQLGQGWDPQHHQPTDVYTTYNDEDFRLGLNAAQTTLGAIAQLTGTTLTESK